MEQKRDPQQDLIKLQKVHPVEIHRVTKERLGKKGTDRVSALLHLKEEAQSNQATSKIWILSSLKETTTQTKNKFRRI